jgi:hypothetical protein
MIKSIIMFKEVNGVGDETDLVQVTRHTYTPALQRWHHEADSPPDVDLLDSVSFVVGKDA